MKLKLQSCFIVIMLCFPGAFSYAQVIASLNGLEKSPIHSQERFLKKEKFLKAVLNELELKYKVSIAYKSELVKNKKVYLEDKSFESFEEALTDILKPYDLVFKKAGDKFYVIEERKPEKQLEKIKIREIEKNRDDLRLFQNLNISKFKIKPWIFEKVDILVKGKVTSEENGEALPGVNILLKGTTMGTVTDINGNYSVNAPENGILIFSFIGYVALEIPINNRSVIDVALATDVRTLDEVVVIGYGTSKKSDLTGSVAQVKGSEINAFPAANPLITLSGRAAGVQVKQSTGHPGQVVDVRIRGSNSIRGSNEPLYVIDGVPSSPYILNNADIESIEILKDASSTAIYGSRGANGVVLITTKSGKTGETKVSYESIIAVQQLRKKLDLLNAPDYAKAYNILADNSPGIWYYFTPEMIESYGEGTDWQDLMFRSAPMHNHSLTISGGNDKTQFALAGSIYNQEGIIEKSSYERYSTRINFDHKISDRISVDFSSILARSNQSLQNSNGARLGGSIIAAIITAPPFIKPYDEDGKVTVFSKVYPIASPSMSSPLAYSKLTQGGIIENNVNTSAVLSYNIVDGLFLKIRGGFLASDRRNDTYQSMEVVDYFIGGGSGSVTTNNFTSVLNENTLDYNKKFGEKHNFSVLIGQTYQNFVNKSLGGSGRDFLSDVTETYNLSTARTPGVPTSSYHKSVILSYLGRINYNYDNTLLFTGSIRADGASKYSPGEKWGYFPSFAIGWKMKEKTFLKDVNFITDLKLRASWGRTGSQAISEYSTLSLLFPSRTVFGNNDLFTTLAPSTSLPFDLRWETTDQKDIGIDAIFLGGKLKFVADYYVKDTRDLLSIVSLPTSTGYDQSIQNIGSIQNRGVEFSVDATLVDKNKFTWDVSGNISFNKNKVVELFKGTDILTGNFNFSAQLNDDLILLREGEPMGVFYGYVEDGYKDNLSKINYKDLNGDGLVNALDKVIIGSPHPDFIFGFNTLVSYNAFSLSAYFQGTYGNDIANVSQIVLHETGYQVNLPGDYLDNIASDDNPNAKYPKPIQGNLGMLFSKRWIEDGSYLRLQHLELGYTLQKGKRSAYFYVGGQNILTLTKYSWWDPEVNSKGGDSIVQGVDHNTYPMSKSYSFGVRLSL